ncbi:uromodulin-like 1 [Mastacembelus armatus]|uniref:uromodulin-like 1 n=1 Tax=Mastacembelus armatus TaxID=205130 RepID=UPI000E457B9D|nr:uromodulin-like 1 [Mastacembelus armatus]
MKLGFDLFLVSTENILSASGYHLCIHNETRTESFLVIRRVPYTVTKYCGGWLSWKTCTVTYYRMVYQTEYKDVVEQVFRCCSGYEQVGRYCALPVNRSEEFITKPGSCPTAHEMLNVDPAYEHCEQDMDCPGWQKCCHIMGHVLCRNTTTLAHYAKNRGYRLNATVTVKTDYQNLMLEDKGLLNHMRLLQAMVTGALQPDNVSVYYLSSWAVPPYRTATSLLIDCNFTLSLYNVTSKLNFLLKHIDEVSSVTVEDVDECAVSALQQCSPLADCNNTAGSYTCICHPGYIDADQNNLGAHCIADLRLQTPREFLTYLTPMNTTSAPASNTTHQARMTKTLNYTQSPHYNSSDPPHQTHLEPNTSTSSAAALPSTAIACSPSSIASLWSENVTGTDFTVYWSSQVEINQTYWVALCKGSEVIHSWETHQTTVEMKGLQPGVLYNVTVTPHACGSQGLARGLLVKTDAQTLGATARLTNIQYTNDLQNTSSQAYKNLTASIINEIYQSLSPELKDIITSGQVRIEIRSFSPGSVVVKVIIVFTPNQIQDISKVSTALLHSLMNSSRYEVDANSTSIYDFNECDSGENDCSLWATCTNTWGSYTCACMARFIDNSQQRPGRACEAIATLKTTTPSLRPSINSMFSNTLFSDITPPTSDQASTTATTTPGRTTVIITTSEKVSTTVTFSSLVSTTSTMAPPTTTEVPVVTSIHAATTTNAATTTTAMASTTTPPRTTVSSLTTIATTSTSAAAALSTTTNAAMKDAISVQCRVSAITVNIARDFLLNNLIREGSLYLGLQECGVNGGNSTHAQLTVGWNECDTRLVHNETHYTASVTLFNTMDPYTSPDGTVEVPKTRLESPITCAYKKSILISSDFGSMGYDILSDVITGWGSFHVTVQLMNGTVPLPRNYSLSPNEAVVVDVSLNTSSEHLKVVINKCWATPTQNPADTYSYTFLENSCSLNAYTKVLMNGNSSNSRVSVQIFSFINLDVIYLHCHVQICVQFGLETCAPDCQLRTARASNTIGTALGSYGPLLKSNEESLEHDLNTLPIAGLACLGVGLTLIFIVGFFCLLYYQRNRIGHYNFNVKPKQENFTYLAFST